MSKYQICNHDEMHTDSTWTDEPVPKDTVSDNLPQSVEHSAVGKPLETEDSSEETKARDTDYPVNLKTKVGKALFNVFNQIQPVTPARKSKK